MKEQQGAVRPLGQERVQAEDGKGRGTETTETQGERQRDLDGTTGVTKELPSTQSTG